MRIAVPDLVTNSYFPALAAEELQLYAAEGVDAHVELLTPAPAAMAALASGDVQCVVTGAHTTLTAFPNWRGAKLAVTVAQGTPWLLVLRADLGAARGDVNAIKGLSIGAAPGPDAALLRLLVEAGIDLERDRVRVVRVPGAERPGASFGVLAAEALESRQIDGFWANALGSETAGRGPDHRGRASWRRPAGGATLHVCGAGRDRRVDRSRARGRRGRRAVDRHRSANAPREPGAGHRSRPPALPARSGRHDRRARRARSAVLRSRHPRGRGAGDERVRPRARSAPGNRPLRARRGDALPRPVVSQESL